MSTTSLTPTSAAAETPKLLKKASANDVKSPTTATQTTFGCQHMKEFLQAKRDRVTSEYGRTIQAIRNPENTSTRVLKDHTATGAMTYLCLQCSVLSQTKERHMKQHAFSVESNNGFVYCHECKDYIYDPTLEEIRSSAISKKRKHAALREADQDTKRLIAANSIATPCAATGLRGLYNMGQTCFMSVILQSLVHNPLIRTYYLAEGHKSTDCEREACTSCALDDIFTDFFGQEKHEGYGAVHMLQGCWKGGGGLAGYSQQDAHEYLGFILNSLHAANTAAGDEDPPEESQSQEEKPNAIGGTDDCDCAIHATFGGLLKSTVTCTSCKNTTNTLDPFMDLSLDIRNQQTVTKKKKLPLTNGTQTTKEAVPMDLTECLDRFTSVESLGSDSYYCLNCSGPQSAKKKLSLSRLPPVIPIHLKRFSHSKTSSTSSKVETKIRFPLTLDLSPYTTSSAAKSKKEQPSPAMSGKKAEYELSSVVVHKGKIDNGHYVSFSRQGDEWFRFDDSMVVQVEEREVLQAEAYMLFYVVGVFDG